jgi:hypothetical protein
MELKTKIDINETKENGNDKYKKTNRKKQNRNQQGEERV